MTCPHVRTLVSLGVLVAAGALGGLPAAQPAAARRSLVLITLDTTRADALGCYGAARPTPALDGLARRGLRYARALSASPLTLPSHTTLLTGLEPPEHGVLDNGTSVLAAGVPTLASVLRARGYATAAFVGSRVLDRRFGLARDFETYGDRMAAERTGEFGYAERDAGAVTAEALAWLEARPAGRPFFLCLHYYDPHAPYTAAGSDDAQRYAAEVAAMDVALGRLLARLPSGAAAPIVAAVGDHGESLGEHGEHGHGLLLHETVLRVPLILAGPGVPANQVVSAAVGSRRLAATLLGLLDVPGDLPGPVLPGLPRLGPSPAVPAIYSETWLPASAFGWSALQSLSEQRWRLVEAPRPELYDVPADPAERADQAASEPTQVARLRRDLRALTAGFHHRRAEAPEPEAAEGVRALGYLSGASGTRSGSIDPKDGIGLLAELDEAKSMLRAGRASDAVARLRDLCRRSPGNVPFLTQLANAQLAGAEPAAALESLRAAHELNPRSEFLALHLAQVHLRLGQPDAARLAYEQALSLDPRDAMAFLGLADLARASGRSGAEREVLERARQAGASSATLLSRLAQLELAAGRRPVAEQRLREATELLPDWAAGWLALGALAEDDGRLDAAGAHFERAVLASPDDAQAQLYLGRLEARRGRTTAARQALERAAALAPRAAAGREAQRLLETLIERGGAAPHPLDPPAAPPE